MAEQIGPCAVEPQTQAKIEQAPADPARARSELWREKPLGENCQSGVKFEKAQTFCEKISPKEYLKAEQEKKFIEDKEQIDEKLSLKIKQEELAVSQKLFFDKQEISLDQVKTDPPAEVKSEAPSKQPLPPAARNDSTGEKRAAEPKPEERAKEEGDSRNKQKLHLKFRELKTRARKTGLTFKDLPQEALKKKRSIEDFIESFESENIKQYLERTIQSERRSNRKSTRATRSRSSVARSCSNSSKKRATRAAASRPI